MHCIAVRLAETLANHSDGRFKKDEIRYGLEVFLGAAFQALIIIIMAFLLGIGKEVFTTLLAAAALRGYSGGVHSQAYYRCTLLSVFIFITLGFLAQYIQSVYFPIGFIFAMICSLAIIVKKAPVDNPINPIIDKNKRQRLKKQSILVVLILLLLAAVAEYFNYPGIAVSILLGIIWQVFTLTKWGHMFNNAWDQAFTFIEKSFQRKEDYNNEQN